MLLLGIDQRDDEPTRSDTIILASLDFEHNRAYVLSVPRDLYVEVPGFLYWKINAAYAIGENPEHTASVGGVGLMMTTPATTSASRR
ncbi:MAG: LCP family protein [Chloroflexia bacterium]